MIRAEIYQHPNDHQHGNGSNARHLDQITHRISLLLDDLAPDFDLAEQKRSVRSLSVAVVPSATDCIPKRIDAVSSHITGCWPIRVPDVIPHENAMQEGRRLCGTSLPHPDTNALVSQRPRKLIVIGYHDSTTPRLRRWLRLRSPYGWRVDWRLVGGCWSDGLIRR